MTHLAAGIFGILIGSALTILVIVIHMEFTKMVAKMSTIEEELSSIKDRQRQTGPTIAGLEDAISISRRLQDNRNIEDVLIQALANTLCTLRQGPYEYDADQASVKREDFK
jgi:hypothetical protein